MLVTQAMSFSNIQHLHLIFFLPKVKIQAADPAGLHHALTTLIQLLRGSGAQGVAPVKVRFIST